MIVPEFERITEQKPIVWHCVHCGKSTRQLRLAGTYLPYYCDECRPEIERGYNRIKMRDYREAKRIEGALQLLETAVELDKGEVSEIRARLVSLLQASAKAKRAWINQTFHYCGDCGYQYDKENDRLDQKCPDCGRSPLAARSHALLKLAKNQWWQALVDKMNTYILAVSDPYAIEIEEITLKVGQFDIEIDEAG